MRSFLTEMTVKLFWRWSFWLLVLITLWLSLVSNTPLHRLTCSPDDQDQTAFGEILQGCIQMTMMHAFLEVSLWQC